jgi:hypothetical protein
VLKFDEDKHQELEPLIFDQMRELGYETHNTLKNLGSLAIFLLYWIVKLPVLVLLQCSQWLCRRGGVRRAKMIKSMFFGELISLLLEAAFEVSIASFLVFKQPLFTMGSEIMSFIIGVLVSFLTFIFIQGAIVWLVC